MRLPKAVCPTAAILILFFTFLPNDVGTAMVAGPGLDDRPRPVVKDPREEAAELGLFSASA